MKRKHLFGKGIIVALGAGDSVLCRQVGIFNILHQDDVLDGMVELRTQVSVQWKKEMKRIFFMSEMLR